MQNTANCVVTARVIVALRQYFCLCTHPSQILTVRFVEIIIIIIIRLDILAAVVFRLWSFRLWHHMSCEYPVQDFTV
jgi:hypothetical protein